MIMDCIKTYELMAAEVLSRIKTCSVRLIRLQYDYMEWLHSHSIICGGVRYLMTALSHLIVAKLDRKGEVVK